jgi:5-methylcytosine-specific restriction protein A
VANLRGQSLEDPTGNPQPKQSSITTTAFLRDPVVKAWVLNSANGICEACSQPAPFERTDGSAYLEVHHLLPLSEGGEDTTRNSLAVCPNCHRQLHYGADKSSLVSELCQRITRLNPENGS